MELLNDSSDIDRAFNPFQKRSGAQANISIDSPLPLNQVNHFFYYNRL